jgi:hypothetical protein
MVGIEIDAELIGKVDRTWIDFEHGGKNCQVEQFVGDFPFRFRIP